ncbi:hypothetical protein [Staphylococcus felis]|uniref:hypothetical protein n=1 Tax=Staphylococcus felis TaxID=46127 RepID=UPI000E266F66|nr:hypothetical protein [Staphylococcus felis]REI09523.1 hypothetical protein DOS69_01945 [Staphylococcus felis]REI33601.1 hypothetical protein DOS82_05740 [Staphylococcus felis]
MQKLREEELKKAVNYFEENLLEVTDTQALEYAALELVGYLSANGFKFEDVASHFDNADLIDEDDISRLFEYVYVVPSVASLSCDEYTELAHNDSLFLIVHEDGEDFDDFAYIEALEISL